MKNLTRDEADKLFRDFKAFRDGSNEVFIEGPVRYGSDPNGKHFFVKFLRDEDGTGKGVSWKLRFSNHGFMVNGRYLSCSVQARINPKILTGTKDYITAATVDYLDEVITRYNRLASMISRYLGDLAQYSMNRCDYCVNFDTKELKLPCSPAQMMTLISRSDIPAFYTEWTEYDDVARRRVPGKHSYRLKSGSVTVSCYWKRWHLDNEFPDCPSYEDSLDVIRFEVQCMYTKVHAMTSTIKNSMDTMGSDLPLMLHLLLSDALCADVIRKQYDRVIKPGAYHTLDRARSEVYRRFKKRKASRLIDTLELVNSCRGIAKAKSGLQGKELDDFKLSLRDLADIGVNPVTIPREWGIPYIRNPLYAYYDRICDEQMVASFDNLADELLVEYLAKGG
jgi:hypothetical protein